MTSELEPRPRPTIAIFMVLGVIVVWAVIVASVAPLVTRWPALIQLVFYLVAGFIWVLPLKPIMRWSETGRWRGETHRP